MSGEKKKMKTERERSYSIDNANEMKKSDNNKK